MEQYLGSEKHQKSTSEGGKARAKQEKAEANQRIENYNKNPKKCLQCQTPIFHNLGKLAQTLQKLFCSHSCSAKYNNKHRDYKPSEDKKTKEIYCRDCGQKIIVNVRACAIIRCDVCKKKKYEEDKRKYELICKSCGNKFFSSTENRKYCIHCVRSIAGQKAGRASVAKQAETRRSKNEIYFAELCKEKFQNVKTNEAVFNGWDADVILPDQKIAILWNGKWHYQKITAKHSVEQVQNRDKIKQKEIEKMGYKLYIIKDLGKYNRDFVEEEFKKFLKYGFIV